VNDRPCILIEGPRWGDAEFYGRWLLAAAATQRLFKEATKDQVFDDEILVAQMLRIEAGVFPREVHSSGCILGSDGDCSRPKASPGMWRGHVGVVTGNVLLGPTLAQVNDDHPYFSATAMVVEFAPEQPIFFVPTGDKGAELRFKLFLGHCGWKGAPDFRFKSRRRPIIKGGVGKTGRHQNELARRAPSSLTSADQQRAGVVKAFRRGLTNVSR
jgi:hypothetical protein